MDHRQKKICDIEKAKISKVGLKKLGYEEKIMNWISSKLKFAIVQKIF